MRRVEGGLKDITMEWTKKVSCIIGGQINRTKLTTWVLQPVLVLTLVSQIRLQ